MAGACFATCSRFTGQWPVLKWPKTRNSTCGIVQWDFDGVPALLYVGLITCAAENDLLNEAKMAAIEAPLAERCVHNLPGYLVPARSVHARLLSVNAIFLRVEG